MPQKTELIVRCPICGMIFVSGLAADERQHRRHCLAAQAARAALSGVGPCPLPLSYEEREALKERGNKEALTHARNMMWSHFARSLSAWNFDLAQHPIWERYAQAYLADRTNPEIFGANVGATLVREFGGAHPHPSLPPGMTEWRKPGKAA
ncbi:MAG: C2H2-type zinc finger protein [Stellaceae bacterium]